MEEKFTVLLAGKRKGATIGACAALLLTVGTITAYAASSGSSASLVRVEDGNVTYSTDNGKTWVDGKPNGFRSDGYQGAVIIEGTEGEKKEFSFDSKSGSGVTKNQDGSVSIGNTLPAKDKVSSLVRVEDGNIRYSTDNGKTWKNGAPEGLKTETDEKGGTRSWVGDRPENGDGATTAENQTTVIRLHFRYY
ncbi:hypothetical protein ACI7RC_16925 [Brevibacillus sp. B_LB10_24]|uniref:hypothetical protein n=1 Tax=Brevibacillus sp. B_LB10_24 TaxID=3380645 RepID=UPI0038BC1C5B